VISSKIGFPSAYRVSSVHRITFEAMEEKDENVQPALYSFAGAGCLAGSLPG
jgi:hypothetical protein